MAWGDWDEERLDPCVKDALENVERRTLETERDKILDCFEPNKRHRVGTLTRRYLGKSILVEWFGLLENWMCQQLAALQAEGVVVFDDCDLTGYWTLATSDYAVQVVARREKERAEVDEWNRDRDVLDSFYSFLWENGIKLEKDFLPTGTGRQRILLNADHVTQLRKLLEGEGGGRG